MEKIKWMNKILPMKSTQNKISTDEGYKHLLKPDDDESSIDEEQNTVYHAVPPQGRLVRALIILSKTILVLFAIWGIFSAGARARHHILHSKPVSCSCGGTTVAEAKARGCIFTPLAISWLPPQCLDLELADEFDAAGPEGGWPYWGDINGTIPLTREEVGAIADTRGGVFYTTQEWHVMHCMYTWRKHYRSLTNGVTVERRSNGIDHIHHCEKIVTAEHPLKEVWTMAGIELNADLA